MIGTKEIGVITLRWWNQMNSLTGEKADCRHLGSESEQAWN